MTLHPAAVRGLFAPVGPATFATVTELLKRRPVAMLVEAGRSRSHHRHPFTFDERADMIGRIWPTEWEARRLVAVPVCSDPYDADRTDEAVAVALARAGRALDAPPIPRDGLVLEPAGDGALQRGQFVALGRIIGSGYPGNRVPPGLRAFAKEYAAGPVWPWLNEEFVFCDGLRRKWKRSPYPPTFNAADALVRHRGKVLLIRRRDMPGRGLLALPGGHVDPEETLFAAALREAHEEACPSRAGRDVSAEEFAAACTGEMILDEPWRDPRGRYFSRVFRFDVTDAIRTRAGDDAESVHWLRPAEIERTDVFADHWFAIRALAG